MIDLAKKYAILAEQDTRHLWEHNDDKVLIFMRGRLVFAFNFHPVRSHVGYRFPAPAGRYRIVLNSDDNVFGGHNRADNRQEHFALASEQPQAGHQLSLYLPNRTVLVLERFLK